MRFMWSVGEIDAVKEAPFIQYNTGKSQTRHVAGIGRQQVASKTLRRNILECGYLEDREADVK
jgi:hypothetical protein